MQAKTLEKYDRAVKAIAGGMKMQDALKQEKMSGVSYYAAKKEREKAPRKPKHKFVDFTPAPRHQIAVIICGPEDIRQILGAV